MMEFVFFILLVLFMFLCIKTIKLQGKQILKLEAFVSDYLEGKHESVHKRNSKDDEPVGGTDQGRHRTTQE